MDGPAAAFLAARQTSGGQLWRRGLGMRPAGGGAARAAQRERCGGEFRLFEIDSLKLIVAPAGVTLCGGCLHALRFLGSASTSSWR